MRLPNPLLLAAALLALAGLAWPWLGLERTVPLALAKAGRDAGYAYSVATLPWPKGTEAASDDNEHPARSRMRLLEDGKALGPPHSLHGEVRELGQGRYSHWGRGLLFSASDNSDPRRNGRAYTLAYDEPLPPVLGWLLVLASCVSFVLAGRHDGALALGARRLAGLRMPALRPAIADHGLAAALFAVLATCAIALGPERSGWILVTQPLDALHATYSLLGDSGFLDGTLLHKESYSALQQVALLSGADVQPDESFRRPVYAFIGLMLAPVMGVAAALLAVNLLSWAACVGLTYRFARRFYDDEVAARWAALLAAAGIGFVVHALDLGAHLLAFAFYMAGVVAIFESDAWRSRVPLRTHLAIGAFLVLACLQSGAGVALVAGYLAVTLRRNPARHVIPVCVAALAVQPLWSAIVGELYQQRRGIPLAGHGVFASADLKRSLSEWGTILASPVDALGRIARYLFSFATFEMPIVVIAGGARWLAGLRRGPEERSRAMFALPFIVLPLAAALVFAPSAPARGNLVYGISIFFFAGTGAVLAALVRRRESLYASVAALTVVASIAWSTAHLGNVMGPAKAYYMGLEPSRHLFVPQSWEVQSLTNSDPTPRLFGGTATLAQAGLGAEPPAGGLEDKRGAYAVFAIALFAALLAGLLAALVPLAWPTLAGATLFFGLAAYVAGQLAATHVSPMRSPDRIMQVAPGTALTYEVYLGTDLRKRLAQEIEHGAAVAIFPAFYTGEALPSVRIDRDEVAILGRMDRGTLVLDPKTFLSAQQGKRHAILCVTFPGGEGAWIGGWQRKGQAGRRLVRGSTEVESTVLPAVELRLFRDLVDREPILFAF